MNQREQIQETFRRVLQQATLRALLRPSGKSPIEVDAATAAAMLEPFEAYVDSDFAICCEVAAQLEALAAGGGVATERPETDPVLELSSEK